MFSKTAELVVLRTSGASDDSTKELERKFSDWQKNNPHSKVVSDPQLISMSHKGDTLILLSFFSDKTD